jgi:hypothetical protein
MVSFSSHIGVRGAYSAFIALGFAARATQTTGPWLRPMAEANCPQSAEPWHGAAWARSERHS